MSTIINLTSSRFKLKSHQINLWVKNLHLSNSNSLTVSVLCCSVCTIVFLPLSFGVRGGGAPAVVCSDPDEEQII